MTEKAAMGAIDHGPDALGRVVTDHDYDPFYDPSIPAISYCRIFQVGAICPKLCGDCAATYRRKREHERTST